MISLASSESGRLFEQRDLDIAEEIGRRVGASIDNARLFEMTQQERRRAEEASRAKDELLSVTSHELRTPLNAILGWSRMLRSGTLSEEKRERALETIERNAKIQVQLVEDLLDFSRVITGKLRLALAPLEPAAGRRGGGRGHPAGGRGQERAAPGPPRPRRGDVSTATPGGSSRSSGTCCRTR